MSGQNPKNPDLAGTWPLFDEGQQGSFPADPQQTLSSSSPGELELAALDQRDELRQLRDASGVAYLRGLLLCQGESYRPETLVQAIDALTPKQFEDGLAAFKTEKAVIAVGTK